jgi:integrase/recombinase XerD
MHSTKETTLTPESIARHRSWLIERGASEHTARAYSSDLTLFFKDRGTYLLMPSTEPSITETDRLRSNMMIWLNSGRKRWSAKTTQRRSSALKSWLRYAEMPNLLESYRNPTAARGEAHPLPGGMDDVQRLLTTAATPERAALVALCALVGCRVSEACSVRGEWIDYPKRSIRIYGKGSKDRIVPISDRAFPYLANAHLRAHEAGRPTLLPFSERQARKIITALGKHAGLSVAISSHDLRMTFGTLAYAKTKDLRAVQELLGHASSKTTETYTGVSGAAMREAADL